MDTMKERLEKVLHAQELEIQHLKEEMPIFEKWGAGPYRKHELSMREAMVNLLMYIKGGGEDVC